MMSAISWRVLVPAAALLLMLITPLLSGRVMPASLSPVLLASSALTALMVAIAAAVVWWRRRDQGAATAAGVLLGLTAPVLVAVLFVFPRAPVPQRFNDVSTDLVDPPVLSVGPNAGAPYPERFAAWQRAGYPQLVPVRLTAPPERVFTRIQATARELGWEIVHTDAPAGLVQAVARTPLFRFEDDVVLRVRPDGAGSRLDLRSKSRFGTGDRGANAARVQQFVARVQARAD